MDKDKSSVVYNFICDKVVTNELREKVLDKCKANTARVFSHVNVKITKIVANDDLINRAIYKFLKDNYPSVSIFLAEDDIISSVDGNLVKYEKI